MYTKCIASNSLSWNCASAGSEPAITRMQCALAQSQGRKESLVVYLTILSCNILYHIQLRDMYASATSCLCSTVISRRRLHL